MTNTRFNKILNKSILNSNSIENSITSIKKNNFYPESYYTSCSKLPDFKNTSFGNINEVKMYFLMEGGKRIFGTGQSTAFSLLGSASEDYFVFHQPTMAMFDIPLDEDDYIINFTLQRNCSYFVTEKGYFYSGVGQNNYGTLGDGTNINRWAYTRVNHALSQAGAVYSSGGAIGSNTMVISAVNASITIGQYVVGTGCPVGMQVTGVSGTTITFNYPFHVLAAGNYSFGIPFGPGGVVAKKVYANGNVANAGEKFVYVLGQDGNVYSSGYCGHGQLGRTDLPTTDRWYYHIVSGLSNVKEISLGMYSAFFITNSGQLYAIGYNGNGCLGLGDTTNRTTPTLSATNVAKAFTNGYGQADSFYISNTGKVYACGYNGNGELGLGLAVDTTVTSWTEVTTNLSGKNVIHVSSAGGNSAAYQTTWFLVDDGTVYGCGYNGYGALGDGTTTSRNTPTLLIQPSGFPKVDKIFCGGGSNTTFLTGVNMESGRMWSVGSWNYGAIGQALGSVTGTWEMTITSTRAQYPAREVTSPPPVEDGYTSISEFCVLSEDNGQTAVWCLLNDGTVWVRGYTYDRGQGHRFISGNGTHEDAYGIVGDFAWKQVEFY